MERKYLFRPRGKHPLAWLTAGLALLGLASGAVAQTGAKGNGIPSEQCATLAMWTTSARLPNGASPFAGYQNMIAQSDVDGSGRNLEEVAFVIQGEYPFAGYGGWFIYPKTYEAPTGGATFPNIDPNLGSINPFLVGNPVYYPFRKFTLVLTSSAVTTDKLPPLLRAVLPADASNNHIFWPANNGSFIMLMRVYNEWAGYDLGGTGGPNDVAWPTVKSYNVRTGLPIPCGDVEVARDAIQSFAPWNTEGYAGIQRIPLELRGLLPFTPNNDPALEAPKPDPDLVQFFRAPSAWTGWPGGVVPNVNQDSPDYCANYIVSVIDQDRIALIRMPKFPSYPDPNMPKNSIRPATDVGAWNMQVMGRLRANYEPGSPDTFAIDQDETIKDDTGGATFVVWPTTLGRLDQRRVFKYAQDQGWNLLQGNLESVTNYASGIVLRFNGPASTSQAGTYPTASRTGVPCMYGPQSALPPGYTAYPPEDENDPSTWFINLPSDWMAQYSNMGPFAPQGVQCDVDEFLDGSCQQRLEDFIGATGGSYYATE